MCVLCMTGRGQVWPGIGRYMCVSVSVSGGVLRVIWLALGIKSCGGGLFVTVCQRTNVWCLVVGIRYYYGKIVLTEKGVSSEREETSTATGFSRTCIVPNGHCLLTGGVFRRFFWLLGTSLSSRSGPGWRPENRPRRVFCYSVKRTKVWFPCQSWNLCCTQEAAKREVETSTTKRAPIRVPGSACG